MTRRSERALAFAATHFAGCSAHLIQAEAVHEQLAILAKSEALTVAPDDRIADLLGHSASIPDDAVDSLDRVELEMALEEELLQPELVKGAVGASSAEHTLATLLGPWRPYCPWDPETVWLRSVRGIINERVRHSGGCYCAPISAPSNNKMQRTSHG